MKYLLLTLSAVLLFSACNKTPTVDSSTGSILRTGKWRVSGGTVTLKLPNGKDTSISYNTLLIPICHQDDYITFDTGVHGTLYAGATTCSAGDPPSIGFIWELINNDQNINIYNTSNFYFLPVETIQPYHFDTITKLPTLVLDSLYTPNGEIDSICNLQFTSTPALANDPTNTLVDLYNASITKFSQSSFTLNFAVYGSYPDSTGFHTAFPVIRPDTFHYSIIFSNF